MKRPKTTAQMNETTPWSKAGGRRCIARDPTLRPRTKKIHRAGCAFVHLPREPSASAYGPSGGLRPTRAPCSVPAERTAPAPADQGGGAARRPAFCATSVGRKRVGRAWSVLLGGGPY